jgi:hypothetical protein
VMVNSLQRSLCRCGRSKIVANGHCAICYALKRQMRLTSAICGKRFSNAMATPAGYLTDSTRHSLQSQSPAPTQDTAPLSE